MSKRELSANDAYHAATRSLWLFSHDNTGAVSIWFGYGAIQIDLSWDDFLSAYVWSDPSAKLRKSRDNGGWFALKCRATPIEMRITNDALGFRFPAHQIEKWLWRDDLIRWAAGGGDLPMLMETPPMPRGVEVVSVAAALK